MVTITLVSSTDCGNCAEVREQLQRLKADYPQVVVQEHSAATPTGQQLIINYGIMQSPGIVINGEFFAAGRTDEGRLRQKVEAIIHQEGGK